MQSYTTCDVYIAERCEIDGTWLARIPYLVRPTARVEYNSMKNLARLVRECVWWLLAGLRQFVECAVIIIGIWKKCYYLLCKHCMKAPDAGRSTFDACGVQNVRSFGQSVGRSVEATNIICGR